MNFRVFFVLFLVIISLFSCSDNEKHIGKWKGIVSYYDDRNTDTITFYMFRSKNFRIETPKSNYVVYGNYNIDYAPTYTAFEMVINKDTSEAMVMFKDENNMIIADFDRGNIHFMELNKTE